MLRLTPVFAAPFLLVTSALAQSSPTTLPVDTFESGVAAWTKADKNRVGLCDIVASSRGATPSSKGAATITFKSGQNAWASVSRAVDGRAWSNIGAQELHFWLSGSGDTPGVSLQLRGKIGGRDVAWTLPRPVRLDIPSWRQVAIPLTDFKGPRGQALAPYLSGVYALQFQQSGTWNSRFFSVDDIWVKGTGRPLVAAHPRPTPAPSAPPAASGETTVQVDFLRTSGTIRASGNPTIGAPFDARTQVVLEANPTFRQNLATLAPKWVRLDAGALVDIADSSAPTFSFSRLVASATRARELRAQILIVLPNAPEWGLDERGYASLCTQTARALSKLGVRAYELQTAQSDQSNASALTFYNAGYAALKALSRTNFVGGTGASAANASAIGTLLRGARGLDFLAVSFYGSADASGSDAQVLGAARNVSALKTAAGLLDRSRFRRSALFVAPANLSGAVNGQTPDDPRLTGMIAAAWWGQFLPSGSRLADEVFGSDATNPEWGLLDASSFAYPAYYATWMWNTFFPAGSTRVGVTSNNEAVFVAASNTKAAHNVLLVNTTGADQTAQLAIRGFPVLRSARLHIFDNPRQSVRDEDLPKSPFQTIKLAPYAVAVAQFTEPPKG